MAVTLVSEGRYMSYPFVVATGVAMTAGSMVFADVSGTNILHLVTALNDSTGFLGILTETLTGPHTGVVIASEGVYRLCIGASTQGWTGSPAVPGAEYFATSATEGRPVGTTAATLTGFHPIGIIEALMTGVISVSGAANTGAYVKIFPFKQLQEVI
jgi:hypothetical protein